MANPTTNYGWPMPTSTDLVTDLPADFAAFGQPVDTSLKALNPETTLGDIAYRSATANTNTRLPIGTNGQVLAVSGGVPAWTTTSDVTPLTTKGDLFTFTTVDARLGVGTNGQVLQADSAEATGLKWATPAVASSGMTLITKASFSAVADTGTTFDNVFSSTYDNYFAVFNVSSSTGTGDLQLQFRYAGPTTQTTNYLWYTDLIEGAGPTSTLSRNTSDSVGKIAEYCGTAPYAVNGTINFQNVLSTGFRPSFIINSFGPEYQNINDGAGYQDTSRAYTGVLFKASAGNITGTVSIYGLAK